MKYLTQFLVISAFYFAGEILNAFIPLPIPSTVYGLVLLFAALCTGAVKLEQVEATGDFLKDIMAIMFVSSAVGVVDLLDVLAGSWVRIVVISVLTTLTTILITGHTAQGLLKLSKKLKKPDSPDN